MYTVCCKKVDVDQFYPGHIIILKCQSCALGQLFLGKLFHILVTVVVRPVKTTSRPPVSSNLHPYCQFWTHLNTCKGLHLLIVIRSSSPSPLVLQSASFPNCCCAVLAARLAWPDIPPCDLSSWLTGINQSHHPAHQHGYQDYWQFSIFQIFNCSKRSAKVKNLKQFQSHNFIRS